MPIFHPHAKTCSTLPLYSESCNFSNSGMPCNNSSLVVEVPQKSNEQVKNNIHESIAKLGLG